LDKKSSDAWLHGLNQEGKIRYARNADRDNPDEKVCEVCFLQQESGFWSIWFDDSREKRINMVKWIELDHGRWVRLLQIGHYGIQEQKNNWDGDRLVRREQFPSEAPKVSNDKLTIPKAVHVRRIVDDYSYSADGELERVTEVDHFSDDHPPTSEVRYQRVPKGVSLTSLLKVAEEVLVSEIPKMVREAKVREPVYALILQYTGTDTDTCFYFPPLFLPTEKLRRRVLPEDGNDGSYILWAVPEWETGTDHVALTGKADAFEKRFQLVFQLKKQYSPIRKMFQRVCARLNEFDWKGVLKTTDDFIVIPYDPHMELDLKVDLKACVPVNKLNLLMTRKYIGRMKLK
jgi:hypothetical protein